MLEWSLENLIRTCLYLACFFTVIGVVKFVIFAIKMQKLKSQNLQLDGSFLFDEVFTFQSVSAFFIGFGWLGYFLLTSNFDVSVTYCMVSAVMAGFICLQLSVKTIFLMKKNLFKPQEEQENQTISSEH